MVKVKVSAYSLSLFDVKNLMVVLQTRCHKTAGRIALTNLLEDINKTKKVFRYTGRLS